MIDTLVLGLAGLLGTGAGPSRVGLYRVDLFSTTPNESNWDRPTFELKSRARERACVNIRGGVGQDGSRGVRH